MRMPNRRFITPALLAASLLLGACAAKETAGSRPAGDGLDGSPTYDVWRVTRNELTTAAIAVHGAAAPYAVARGENDLSLLSGTDAEQAMKETRLSVLEVDRWDDGPVATDAPDDDARPRTRTNEGSPTIEVYPTDDDPKVRRPRSGIVEHLRGVDAARADAFLSKIEGLDADTRAAMLDAVGAGPSSD